MALTQRQVSELYVSIFGRSSEGFGNKFWQQSETATDAANGMLESQPAKDYFGTALDDNQAFVEHIYKNTLNKTLADDEAGIKYWVDALNAGTSKGEVVASLVAAVAKYADSTDAKTKAAYDQFNNRVDVSDYVATKIENVPANGDLSVFKAYNNNTTNDVATKNSQIVKVDAYVAAANKGQTYELTSGTDKLVGTDKNDFFDASIAQNPFAGGVSNTLSSADKLDGGAGTDTLHAELVAEFVGATSSGYQIDVQPKTTSIENVTFEARDAGGNGTANTLVTVDAKNMTGVQKIGSKFSDGDLVIENLTTLTDDGAIRHTSDMTITMDHTDSMNSDSDASDLTVYFDEDYLNRTTDSKGSTLTINMINTLNLELNDGSSLIEGFEKLTFSVDGQLITVDVSGAELSEVQGLIEAAIAEAGFNDITVSTYEEKAFFGTNIYHKDSDTTYPAGEYAGTYTAFLLTNSGSEELTEGGFTIADGKRDGSLAYSQNDKEAQVVDLPISINVELNKVGRDGDGGNLTIGGKDITGPNTDVDQNDGIEEFNITVLGNKDLPSNLGKITSTNSALKTVIVKSETRTDDSYASLTVRDSFGGTLTTFNADNFKGDLFIGEKTAASNIDTFSAMGGGNVTLNEVITGAAVAPAVPGSEQGVDYTVTTGAGADTIDIKLDGDAVDTIGESFSLSTNGGNDTVTLSMDTTNDVSQATMTKLKNLSLDTADGDDSITMNNYGNFAINAGTGNDFVHINSLTAGTNGNATVGTWTFGTTTAAQTFNARVLVDAKLTVMFAGFEVTATVKTDAANNYVATQADINAAIKKAIESDTNGLAKLLTVSETAGTGTVTPQLTITSNIGGDNNLGINLYQPELLATNSAAATGKVVLSSGQWSAIAAGLIQTGAAANSLTVDTEAEVVTAMAALDGSLSNTGAVVTPALQTDVLDAVTNANFLAFGAGGSTNSATGINSSSIDAGDSSSDQDIVVFHSNTANANTLIIDSVFGKTKVVNFFDNSPEEQGTGSIANVGMNAIDFSTFLTTKADASAGVVGNTQSVKTIAETQNIPTSFYTAVGAGWTQSNNPQTNSINVLRMDEQASATSVKFSALTVSDLISALNTAPGAGVPVVGGITNATLNAADYNGAAGKLVDGTLNYIVMVENVQNPGEYKVFHLTAEANTTTGVVTGNKFSTTGTELGTLDFGAAINFQSANSTGFKNYKAALETAVDAAHKAGATTTAAITYVDSAGVTQNAPAVTITAPAAAPVATAATDANTVNLTQTATANVINKAGNTVLLTSIKNIDAAATLSTTAALAETMTGVTGAITVTGATTVAQANAIAAQFTGVVTIETAISTSNDAAVLNAALTTSATDKVLLDVNGTAAASDLIALDGKTATVIDATGVKTLTGTYAEIKAVMDANTNDTATETINVTGGTVAMTVSGTLSAAEVNTLNAYADAGVITATVSDSALNLQSLTTGATDILSVTPTDTSISVAVANIIDTKTGGVITATLSETTLASLATLSGTGNAYTTGVLTDTVELTTAEAAAVVALDAKTTVAINLANTTTTAGTAADIAAVLGSAGVTDSGAVTAKVDAGAADIVHINTINANTTVAVNATAVTSITNSATTASTIDLTDATVTWNTAAVITTITGGTGVDTITVPNTQVTTIIGGAGADVIDLTAGGTGGAVSIGYSKLTDGSTKGIVGVVTGYDTVANFISADDKIVIDGALETAVNKNTDVTLDVTTLALNDAMDVATAELVFVSKTVNASTVTNDVLAADLANTTKVAALLDEVIGTISDVSGTTKSTLFAIESQDVAGKFALYAWTQSGNNDITIDANEINVLGIVTADTVAATDFTF